MLVISFFNILNKKLKYHLRYFNFSFFTNIVCQQSDADELNSSAFFLIITFINDINDFLSKNFK